jgi:3-isopropylmalate/(R)-2-methylmalate dehydratase small subunit
MEPFTTLTAVAIPIDQPNLDTDQIIPARFLGKPRNMQVSAVFNDLRYDPEGRPRPDFVMNQTAFADAKIVVAERNFACGSSRENAVTVMLDNGLRAFIAPSFGDIFFNNCFQNGALPIRLDAARVATIRAALRI